MPYTKATKKGGKLNLKNFVRRPGLEDKPKELADRAGERFPLQPLAFGI
jgi:hypothetical protein